MEALKANIAIVIIANANMVMGQAAMEVVVVEEVMDIEGQKLPKNAGKRQF